LAATTSPKAQILGLFADLGQALASSTFRGCNFANASAEARPDESIMPLTAQYRAWVSSVFTDLAGAAGASDPGQLGRQLVLLYNGAAVAARLDDDRPGAADAAQSAAAALIEAATMTRPSKRRSER
jgi:hypothetical protein